MLQTWLGVYQRRCAAGGGVTKRCIFLLTGRRCTIYTACIGAAGRAWCAEVARCIFSECLNESTLQVSYGAPPGRGTGPDQGRCSAGRNAPIRLLLKVVSKTGTEFRSVLDDVVTTVFPSDCRICSTPLLRSTLLPVCDVCRTAVMPQTGQLCRCCGEALDIDLESARFASHTLTEGLLCRYCKASPPEFERAVAYAVYEREVREMIHLLKYERMRGVAKLLGGSLAETILTFRAEAAAELDVAAVPLFGSKERERGYNQSELLAEAAIRELRMRAPEWKLRSMPGLLRRRRDTRSHFELNPTARRGNVRGAFEVNQARLIPGREVLLIDDIYTTGATARECAKALRRAGVGKVWVATLARAQMPQVAMWSSG